MQSHADSSGCRSFLGLFCWLKQKLPMSSTSTRTGIESRIGTDQELLSSAAMQDPERDIVEVVRCLLSGCFISRNSSLPVADSKL